MKLLSTCILSVAVSILASCGKAPVSTAVTCTSSTSSSSSSTSISTCTDPVTNISVTISPATVSVNVVNTQQFLDFIQGGTNNVTIWKVNTITGGNDTIGRIDSNGLYHAPTTIPSPAIVSVTAVSFEDQNVSATSTVTITPAPIVKITTPSSPVTVTAGAANTVTFSATETGGTTGVILWYVGPVGGLGVLGGNATLGTITAGGVYSAPRTPPIGQTVSVIAVAQDSPTSSASLPVTIAGYSTSSLAGHFAFSLSGNNAAGHFSRAGSFVADGAGNLSSVLEDVTSAAGTTTTPISAIGSYTLGPDGRGTLQFSDGLTPASFDIVLVNANQLQVNGMDATGTATGQADLQDASAFTNTPFSALSGTYVFDFSGVDGSNGLSQIGEFSADGAGNITNGSIDINDGGVLSQFQVKGSKTTCTPAPPPAPQPPAIAVSAYTIGSNGRGTLTLSTELPSCFPGPVYTLNFYVVSVGSAKFVGSDAVKQVAGFTSLQTANAALDATALNGNYAFLLGGSAPSGAIGTAGSFLADGNGNITSGVLDENMHGTPALDLPFLPVGASDGKYTVSSNGRGTITFATAARTYTFVFYLGQVGSNTTAVLQETDSGIASHGLLTLQQSAPFTLASIEGKYAMHSSGTSGSTSQVTTGQLGANGAGTVTAGELDINTGGTPTQGQALTGTYTAPAATGRATLALNSGTLNYAAYVVSPTQIYILGIQPGQLAVGSLLRQF